MKENATKQRGWQTKKRIRKYRIKASSFFKSPLHQCHHCFWGIWWLVSAWFDGKSRPFGAQRVWVCIPILSLLTFGKLLHLSEPKMGVITSTSQGCQESQMWQYNQSLSPAFCPQKVLTKWHCSYFWCPGFQYLLWKVPNLCSYVGHATQKMMT